jgi:RNA polymerase sigma factor (sigma-70 family)
MLRRDAILGDGVGDGSAPVYPAAGENKRPSRRIPYFAGPIRRSRRETTLSLSPDDARSTADEIAERIAGKPGDALGSSASDPRAGPLPSRPLADGSIADPAVWLQHADELRRFVLGVTRNSDLTADVLQNTFAKAVEQGHAVSPASFKAWLFKVAYNEAMLHHRRRATGDRVIRRVAWEVTEGEAPPEIGVARQETVDAVREALRHLPAAQQEVVRRRMYEQQKFTEIAEELGLPLGTVLSRMQLAIKKLRVALEHHGGQPTND